MNTKSNFDRRLVLTIGVLLTTIWLPLTTFAQDSSKSTHSQILRDCEKSTEILTASTAPNTRTPEKEVGFSETNPADQQSENIETVTRAFIVRAHVNVGFSETDPAADMFNSFGETDYQTLADCHGKKAKEVMHETPNFSSLTIKGNHHDHC